MDSTNQSLNDACDQPVSFLKSLTLDDQDDENCSNTVVPTDETIQLLGSEEIEQFYTEVSNKMLSFYYNYSIVLKITAISFNCCVFILSFCIVVVLDQSQPET